MNFEKALARPTIKARLKEVLSDFFSAYKAINSRYLWVCSNPKGIEEGRLCVTLDLKTLKPHFTRAYHMEQNVEMVFKKNSNKNGPEYLKFDFGKFANITEEEYVAKTSSPYCQQAVETGSRRSEEQQTVESSSASQKNNSRNK